MIKLLNSITVVIGMTIFFFAFNSHLARENLRQNHSFTKNELSESVILFQNENDSSQLLKILNVLFDLDDNNFINQKRLLKMIKNKEISRLEIREIDHELKIEFSNRPFIIYPTHILEFVEPKIINGQLDETGMKAYLVKENNKYFFTKTTG